MFWNCYRELSSFDYLSTFLSSNCIEILGLCETLLSDSNSSLVGISGYTVVTRNRATCLKGGLTLFINQDLHDCEITVFSDYIKRWSLNS